MVVHVFDIYLIIVYEKSHPTSCYKNAFQELFESVLTFDIVFCNILTKRITQKNRLISICCILMTNIQMADVYPL